MFELLFPRPSSSSYNSKASMAHERYLLDLAEALTHSASSSEPKPSFPKYNVYRMLDGSPYIYFMEFALAGYSKESLSIEMDRGYLVISSKSTENAKEDREYISRGMARRDFSSRFYVGKDVRVLKAKFENGLLVVEMEKMVPEEDKPTPIEVT